MKNIKRTRVMSVAVCTVILLLGGCQEPPEVDISHCVEQARQAQFEAEQAYDACFLEASSRMTDAMDQCDEIAPVNSAEHSQCLRQAIAQFRTDVGACVDAHNQRIRQAINALRECIREVVNPGN